MSEEKEKELIHYFLQHMLNRHFKSKTNMAKALNMELRTIQKMFSQLERNSSKGGSIILEKILMYCTQNGISVDEVMAAYREEQGMTLEDEKHVYFPCPQGLNNDMLDVYYRANDYVQSVASYLCPHCKKECHPMCGDEWLWKDCLVSRISMILLSHILTIQENKQELKTQI